MPISNNKIKAGPNRDKTIDTIKGISIFAIILGHLGVDAITRVVFTFHVPIFFIITGYFIKEEPVTLFAKKKVSGLLVPYGLTCAVNIVLGSVIAAFLGRPVLEAAKEWIVAGLYGSGSPYTEPFKIIPIGAIWFLWATFWGSVLLQISLKWKPALRVLWVFGLFAAGYYSARKLFWFPLSIQAGFCAVFFMYVGYCLKQCKDALQNLSGEVRLMAGVVSFSVWFSFIRNFKGFSLVNNNFGRGMIDVLASLCACCCILLIARAVCRRGGVVAEGLSFFGRNSLVVLCVHVTEMNMIDWWQFVRLLEGAGVPGLVSRGAAVGVKMMVIVVGTGVIVKVRER